jgi:predicted nucleic acid-binding protein
MAIACRNMAVTRRRWLGATLSIHPRDKGREFHKIRAETCIVCAVIKSYKKCRIDQFDKDFRHGDWLRVRRVNGCARSRPRDTRPKP